MTAALRHRPIFGGVFGKGRYSLATTPCIANGLHAVRYMVIEPKAGAVLAQSDDKVRALSSARRVLKSTPPLADPIRSDMPREQQPLWAAEELPKLAPGLYQRPVGRRRREVYERSHGRCHYCDCGLLLAGEWHVEHMLPKALKGDDHPLNLVAACVQCNLGKGDSTALEFVMHRVSSPSTRHLARSH